MTDLMEGLLDIAPGSVIAELRRRRADIRDHTQAAFEVLVTPAAPGGVTRAERAALAMRVALLERQAALAAHCRALLDAMGDPPELQAALQGPAPGGKTRFDVLLRYADRVATEAGTVDQADIDALSAIGLSTQDIVAVTQLAAFVPFQVRVLAGLRALRIEASA